MKGKKIIARLFWETILLAGLLTMAVFAQAGPGYGLNSDEFLEHLQQDLDLTGEQTAAVRGFMDDSAKREEEILSYYGLTCEQFQVLQKDLHLAMDDFFTKLQTVLTEEQKAEFNRHRVPMGGHRPPPPMGAFAE